MTSATSTSPDTDQLLNGRYRIEERIARGGMATVHRGRDERLDRVVALKIMHPHLAQDEQFRRRFAREARAAARLAHRNVVGVFDQGEDADRIYLAMELIEGETLRERMSRCGALTIDETLAITAQILEALAAAHEAGIVHRDIKPENVLIDSDDTVKVADFGLARAIGAAHSSTSATLLGTVAYISPEVVTRGQCDERSDLYSLGVMVFEMLTGAQPFTGEQPVHIAFQHVHDDIPAPSSRADGIPRSLDSLVLWIAARRPESRPRSARQLLHAVRELRAGLAPSVLAGRPAPCEAIDAATGELPAMTASLDAQELGAAAAARSFPLARLDAAEESDGSAWDSALERESASPDTPDASADDSPDDDPLRTPRAVTMRAPRARRGRHLPHGTRRRSRPIAALAGLALIASLGTGAWAGTDWYLMNGPGADRTVPVLVGTTLADAETALTAADLETRTVEEFSETVPAGHIISARPESGSVVKRGADVRVVVSKGRETFAVPDVAGLSRDEARSRVEAVGLVLVEDDPEYSETVPKGEIISQSQQADALPRGGEVHVVISQGRVPIQIPDQTGKGSDAARSALENAGFAVRTSTAHSGSVPKGSVISQTPSGGTGHRGDTVELVISAGPEMVAVPDVFRKPEAEARSTLEGAGFTVQVRYDRGEPVFGLVYQQSTAAGTKAAKGSTITIDVF